MGAIGRKCSVINLDPANFHTNYTCALDVRDLVKLEEIMEDDELGPNGGILYAMEELEHNIDWLEKGLTNLGEDYVLFDCPGQVELFTHHSSLRNIFFRIQKLGYRVCIFLTQVLLPWLMLTACRLESCRFILLDASVVIHLQPNPVAPRNVANGSTTSQRAHKN